jgi:hypothetical protein
MVNIHEYFTNLGCALMGQTEKASGFADVSGGVVNAGLQAFALVWTLGVLLLIVCNVVGAVHLSWCYNKYIGTPTSLSIVYGILCFFFPMLYYPFYGVFLDPLCNVKKANGRNAF